MSPELEQIRREAERLTRVFSPQQWHEAPPGKWSCGQILEHLRLSYTATTRGVQKGIQTGMPLAGRPTLQDHIKAFVVSRLGYLPAGRVSPNNVTAHGSEGINSLRPFNDALVAMDASLTDAERRFGRKVKLLDHPFIGPLDAQQWRRFHRAHTRHHLKQAAKRAKAAESATPIDTHFSERNSDTTPTRLRR